MSDKKYVLERRSGDGHFLYQLTPAPYGGDQPWPVTKSEANYHRAHPDVEDRTQTVVGDWSHIAEGVGGRATVAGHDRETDGLNRRAYKLRSGFMVFVKNGHVMVVPDRYVTAFTPDVLVDEALIAQIESLNPPAGNLYERIGYRTAIRDAIRILTGGEPR